MKPPRDDITLTNGRIVTHKRLPNGAQDASMKDGGLMSRAEGADYDNIIVSVARERKRKFQRNFGDNR